MICPSRKQTFLTRADAERKLEVFRRKPKVFDVMAVYLCRRCRMWHLTSDHTGGSR